MEERTPPFSSGFNVQQLVEWLKLYHSLSDQACKIVEKESITGSVFRELTEDDMTLLGFNFGSRRTLLNIIKTLGAKLPEQALTRTELDGHHYGKIIEQLVPVKAQWEAIAVELGFKPHEIADIGSNPLRARSNDYIYDVITRWLQWGPPDKRGSKDVATLEALQLALNNTNNARIRLTL